MVMCRGGVAACLWLCSRPVAPVREPEGTCGSWRGWHASWWWSGAGGGAVEELRVQSAAMVLHRPAVYCALPCQELFRGCLHTLWEGLFITIMKRVMPTTSFMLRSWIQSAYVHTLI
jgi:hypothetical protein